MPRRHVPPKPCSTGRAKSPCRSAAGCRAARSCWSSTAPSQRSSSWPPCGRTPASSRACASMPTCSLPHRRFADPATQWQPHTVALWYGRTNRRVEIATGTAVWYHSGLPPVPIRWLLVRDPTGELDTHAFLATDLDVTPYDMLQWFVCRWQIEVTFEEARAHLGMETQRQW